MVFREGSAIDAKELAAALGILRWYVQSASRKPEIAGDNALYKSCIQLHLANLSTPQCIPQNLQLLLQVQNVDVLTSADHSSITQVGAGPTGLILALDLLKNGVKVRIIEKTEVLFIGQRGAGIMV